MRSSSQASKRGAPVSAPASACSCACICLYLPVQASKRGAPVSACICACICLYLLQARLYLPVSARLYLLQTRLYLGVPAAYVSIRQHMLTYATGAPVSRRACICCSFASRARAMRSSSQASSARTRVCRALIAP
jgi:hypothetical protein